MATVASFDPGKNGGFAVFDEGTLIEWGSMPTIGTEYDEAAIVGIMRNVDFIAIERVTCGACKGRMSAFSFGLGWGLLRGIAVALGKPYELVTPKQWQSLTPSRKKGVAGKMQSVATASRLFPQCRDDISRMTKPRKKVKKGKKVKDPEPVFDGIAEAILIGEWVRRNVL